MKPNFLLSSSLARGAVALTLLLSLGAQAQAQSTLPTFTCEADAYNFFNSPSNLQRFDPAALSVISTIPLSPALTVNGIGFNPLDNYIYGVTSNTNGQSGFVLRDFARVGVDGSVESLGQVQPATTGLPAFSGINVNTGTMDASGNWYGISATYIYTVFVGDNPAVDTLTYTAVARTGDNTNVFDIAFSPSDGLLYGSRSKLVRMDPVTGASAIISTTGANPPSAGGAWSTSDGTLYFYNNGAGLLYSIDVTQPTPLVTNLGSVPNNGTFDSAACLPPTITKGIIGTGPDADGNFSYEFTISNAFTSPIFVSFGDPLPASLTYVPGSLSPANPGGGTVTNFTATNLDIAGLEIPAVGTLTFEVAVSVDPNAGGGTAIANQASIAFGGSTIASDDPDTSATGDGTVITIPELPSLSLVKLDPLNDDEDSSTTVTVGDTLNYTITATNDGNMTLTNVVVSDPLLIAPDNTLTCSSLPVGDTCELVGTYSVVGADEVAGFVENTASVVSDEITTAVEAVISTPVAPAPMPSLVMTKVADSTGPYKVGDIVTYTYTVTNNGNEVIRDIVISDTHNGSDPAPTPSNETLLTDSAPLGDSTDAGLDSSWDVLAPGDAVTFTGTYTITTLDATNL